MQSNLLSCSEDIFRLVFEQCEQSTLHTLSLTCKAIRLRCIPELYREVDLSSHNLGRYAEYEDELRPEMWSHLDDENRPENLLPRQRSFLRTMTEYPKYSNYVRSFSWTLIWYNYHKEHGLSEIDYELWLVFSRLVRVEKLDLAALVPEDKSMEQYARLIPSALFPSVKDLRLLGWMNHALVANIFRSINLEELRVLRLDALQEEGTLPDGSFLPAKINKAHWSSEWRARLCKSRTRDLDSNDCGITFPGPMWITFLPLIGKFCGLQYLEIRIPPLEAIERSDICPDYHRYICVMAELIASVRPTLKTLIVEYACKRNWGYEPRLRDRLQYSELMLSSLVSLFDSSGSWMWKSLQSVSLKGFHEGAGIGKETSVSANVGKFRDVIDDTLNSRGVHFEWADESVRAAALFLGYWDSPFGGKLLDQLVDSASGRLDLCDMETTKALWENISRETRDRPLWLG